MPAAPDGRVVVTVPRADGTAVTATLNFDPTTRAFAPRALSLSGKGGATVTVHHAVTGMQTDFPVAQRRHISAAKLAAAGFETADHLHGFSVTAA